jgi:stage V sporulation protein K
MDELLNLSSEEIDNIINTTTEEEKITIENWNNYKNNINMQMTNMWNFMLYNQFNNEEIRRLQQEKERLDRTIKRLNEDNNRLYDDNCDMKKKIDKVVKKTNPEHIKRKINYLKNEFNKQSKRKRDSYDDNMSNSCKKRKLLDIYSSLESIKDIISLKDNVDKFHFVNDEKFLKLYNLIPSLEELDKIIGMSNVKETIFKSICYFIHGINNNQELNHVMIFGPPGVGKTTIAQIIGKIYLELGFLENDKFKVASRSDLVAKYLGQTAIKTQEVIDSVIGGVLFIDEVYSLGNKEGRDSFAKECIDTINLNMTRKEPWLLIVGGYKEDIYDSFMSYNKGLERRFTVKLEINDYTPEELYQILLKFIKEENFTIENNAITVSDIEENKSNFKHFGGDMRKLYKRAKENYSLRLMRETIELNNDNKVLTRDDFMKSLELFKDKEKDKDDRYLFSMYT